MKEEIRKYCVYKHTAPNGKSYIGLTGQRPNRRWQNGYGYIENKYFYRAIQKYGWNNIQHEILEEGLTRDEACMREIYYIDKYKTTDRNFGYNISIGGDLGMMNTPVCMYSYNGELINTFNSYSEASFITGIHEGSISNASNGLSKSAGGYIWRKIDEDFDKYPIPKIDDYFLAKNSLIKIKQYDTDGNLLNTFNSLEECKIKDNYSISYIYKCCIGEVNLAYDFVWRFENDDFNKYFNNYKVRINANNSKSLIIYDNMKFSNIPIYEYDLFGNLLGVYDDVYKVSQLRNIPVYKIQQCLSNNSSSCHNFVYRSERDFEFENSGYKRNTYSTHIKQYDLYGNYIKTYNSIVEAKNETGATNISSCAKGERHQSGGFVWRYENDDFEKYSIENKKPNIQLLYNKKIFEFNLNGTLNATYNSLYEFPRNKHANIAKCLRGEIKSSYGYIYSFDNTVQPYKRIANTKRIAQYDLNTKQLIKIYDSEKEARLETGATKIYECANHKRKSSGGYIWEYVSNNKEN